MKPYYRCRLSLHDLPFEALEKIASHLDGTSLGALAATDSRLASDWMRLPKGLKVPSATQDLVELLKVKGSMIRSLDLSNCRSDSKLIADVILQCPSIRRLNVLKSNISTYQLMKILPHLPELETLSFSHTSVKIDHHQYRAARFMRTDTLPKYPSIKNIYCQITADWFARVVLPILLQQCTGIEDLFIDIVGSPPKYLNFDPIHSFADIQRANLKRVSIRCVNPVLQMNAFRKDLLVDICGSLLDENLLRRLTWINAITLRYEDGEIIRRHG